MRFFSYKSITFFAILSLVAVSSLFIAQKNVDASTQGSWTISSTGTTTAISAPVYGSGSYGYYFGNSLNPNYGNFPTCGGSSGSGSGADAITNLIQYLVDNEYNVFADFKLGQHLGGSQDCTVAGTYYLVVTQGDYNTVEDYWVLNYDGAGAFTVNNPVDSTYLISISPSNQTIPTDKVNFYMKWHIGDDIMSTVSTSSILYNKVCLQFIGQELTGTTTTPYRFNQGLYQNQTCGDPTATSTKDLDWWAYYPAIQLISPYVGYGVMATSAASLGVPLDRVVEVPLTLHQGWTSILISLRSLDNSILYSTSTEIVVGTSTQKALPNYTRPDDPSMSDVTLDSANNLNGCAFDISDIDNASLLDKVKLVAGVTLCDMFLPTDANWQDIFARATSTVLNKFPLGYVTSIITAFATTSTSTLPIIDATIPSGIAGAGANIYLSLDSLAWIFNATSTFTTGDLAGKSLYEIVSPYWNTFIYLCLVFYILSRVLGSHVIGRFGGFINKSK